MLNLDGVFWEEIVVESLRVKIHFHYFLFGASRVLQFCKKVFAWSFCFIKAGHTGIEHLQFTDN